MAKEKLQLIIQAEDKASKKIEKLDSNIDGLKKGMGKLGVSFTAVSAAVGWLGKQMIDAAADFEQTQVAFTTMLGSAEMANTLLRDLAEFAAKTPFELKDVEKGAKALLAFGFEGTKVIPTLKALGDVSAGLSVPMERLILNYGQVKAQTKLTGRELRDFAIAGVPILEELANNLGKSKAEILELVSAGKIGFPEVEEAFESMSSAGGKFYDLMDKQSKTFLGRISNLKDSWDLFLREQGSQLIVWAGVFVNKLILIVDWLRADAEGINLVGKSIFGLISFFKAFGKTVFSVFLPIAGLARITFETGKVMASFVKDGIKGFKNLGKTMQTIFSAFGKALRGNFKQAKLDLQGLMRDAVSETTSQMAVFDNVLADVTFGIKQGFSEAAGSWVDFATLAGFNTVIEKFGVLGKNIEENIGGGADKGKEEVKKLESAFGKLQDKIKDVAVKSKDALGEIASKVENLQKKMNELLVGGVKENLGINQQLAEVFVDQEEKVAELKNKINQETDFIKRELLKNELAFEEEELARHRTILIAHENEINEVRRVRGLSDIARATENLNKKRTLINQEFEVKFKKIQDELDFEAKKFGKIKELQEQALKDAEKFLAQSEIQTVESVNREIARYNELAKAIARAKAGLISSPISVGSSVAQRATQPSNTVNINITGPISSGDAAEQVGNSIVDKLAGAGLTI